MLGLCFVFLSQLLIPSAWSGLNNQFSSVLIMVKMATSQWLRAGTDTHFSGLCVRQKILNDCFQ